MEELDIVQMYDSGESVSSIDVSLGVLIGEIPICFTVQFYGEDTSFEIYSNLNF